MSELQHKVDFGIIRYGNCWEDARVLREAIRLQKDECALIIASAGDNALALLADEPKIVRAIDLSMPQLYLCELKMAAFAHLDYDDVLTQLGMSKAAPGKRLQLYALLRPHIGSGAKSYWDSRRSLIEAGIIHSGKFERYFRMFRTWLLPLVHGRKLVSQLLNEKDAVTQTMFFEQKWNTPRWRMLMNLFFSKTVMGRYGRDPQFLAQVDIDVPAYIRKKAEAHLQSPEATCNPFLHYIFTGAFGANKPEYLREEHFLKIKQHIGRLHLACEDMGAAVAREPFDVYCASNIFEYMPHDGFQKTVASWSDSIPAGARLAYWNLMVPRSFAGAAPGQWRATGYTPDWDAGFFYSRFLSEQKQ